MVAQAGAPLLGLATQVKGVGAEQLLLDLAAGLDVVGAGARGAAEAPELEFEEVARRGTGALAGTLLSAEGEKDAAFSAILAALDDEAYDAEACFAIQPALCFPVALAGGAVGEDGAFAPFAARLAPSQAFGVSHQEVVSRGACGFRNSFFGGGRCSQRASWTMLSRCRRSQPEGLGGVASSIGFTRVDRA